LAFSAAYMLKQETMSFDSFYFYTKAGGISRVIEIEQWINPGPRSSQAKVALVTGGSRGIGAASARARRSRRQCRNSYQLLPTRPRSCGCGIEGQGALRPAPKGRPVASTEEVDQLVKNVARDFGRLDILVNNAGALPSVSGR
jgi:hypothetical protein